MAHRLRRPRRRPSRSANGLVHPTESAIRGLLTVPTSDELEAVRPSANLTLAHLPIETDYVKASMGQMLEGTSTLVQITAAVALAYRSGQTLPDAALDILVHAKDQDPLPMTPPGWDRALRGFVALALQRIGLG